jgi:hypothetical protein
VLKGAQIAFAARLEAQRIAGFCGDFDLAVIGLLISHTNLSLTRWLNIGAKCWLSLYAKSTKDVENLAIAAQK